MPKSREDGATPADCRECKHWGRVRDRVRVHTLLRSMTGKIEARVTSDEFRPTIGDFLKVVDLERDWDDGNEGSTEKVVRWADPWFLSKN